MSGPVAQTFPQKHRSRYARKCLFTTGQVVIQKWRGEVMILPALLIPAFLFVNLLNFPLTTALQSFSNKNTKFCGFNITHPGGSTRRDVVFFFATRIAKGLLVSVKSLRSTGAQCRIILFAPQTISVSWSDTAFLRDMGVELELCAKERDRPLVPHMIRYESEQAWLKEHEGEVDRVFHSDAFDVFFQGDPFAEHILKDALTFVVEPHCIRSCGWNLAWIRSCYGLPAMTRFGHNFIICSGSIGGPAREYERLIELMVSQREWQTCWASSMDQPILNWLVWTGRVAEEGIKYRLAGCDGGFFTMQWCVTEGNVLLNEYGQVVSIEGGVPSYLHQYDRHARFAEYAKRICGF
jgi:hypothetical protein